MPRSRPEFSTLDPKLVPDLYSQPPPGTFSGSVVLTTAGKGKRIAIKWNGAWALPGTWPAPGNRLSRGRVMDPPALQSFTDV